MEVFTKQEAEKLYGADCGLVEEVTGIKEHEHNFIGNKHVQTNNS